jgi:Bacterial tandem repeat domain 1
MAFVTTGLTNGGTTTHYRFSYDQALGGSGGVEPARTNAVIAACETDYNLMSGWFGGGVTVTGMSVQVTTQSNGASWSGTSTSSTIQLHAQGASYSNNAAYLRYLLIAEVTEIFMMTQNLGWFQGSDEGSKGEGLSRFLSGQFLAINGFLNLGIDADYAVANLWLNSPRQDFVNTAPDDHGYNAINGCTTLFIYYLFHEIGYGINQIVAAAGATLTAVYRNLTSDPNDPFPEFKRLLDGRFPSTTGSSVPGPNFDDPWPIGDVAWSGVWRSGSRPYYLWIGAPQSEFVSKWQTLASQNLRLTDIDVSTVNGQQLWSGIWEDGTDGYYLWYDADQAHFLAKWSELSAQNLRLVSIARYGDLYAGVWREGTDGYYLWVDADDDHFLAKWGELAPQNLRLVDFDVAIVNGGRRWCGVWRSGTDGYYLWINADWSHFSAKWSELATQGLRLIGVQYYDGLWAGIWRSGNDGYYLWVDANEAAFLAKWGGLAAQGLRLIDVTATPPGASGSLSAGASEQSAGVLAWAGEETSGAIASRGEESVMGPTVIGGAASGASGSGGGSASRDRARGGTSQDAITGAGGGSSSDAPGAGGTGAGGGSRSVSAGASERGEDWSIGGDGETPDAGTGGGVVALAGTFDAGPTGAGRGGGNVAQNTELDAPAVTTSAAEESGAQVGGGVHLRRGVGARRKGRSAQPADATATTGSGASGAGGGSVAQNGEMDAPGVTTSAAEEGRGPIGGGVHVRRDDED